MSQLSISMDTRSVTGEGGFSEAEERKKKEYGSLGSCLLSMPFWLILLWQAFLEMDVLFTFGTLNFFLTRLSNGDEDLGRYIKYGYGQWRIKVAQSDPCLISNLTP